jgi:hypothetical protein
MAESVKTPLRMTAREFVTCLALTTVRMVRTAPPSGR